MRRFNAWLGTLPHRHKVCIFGNHELVMEANPALRTMLTNARVLINEAVIVEGFTIWGSPMTRHGGGAFAVTRGPDRAKVYGAIPMDTDILVTHMPPFGVLDGRLAGIPSSGGDVELRIAPGALYDSRSQGVQSVLLLANAEKADAARMGLSGDPWGLLRLRSLDSVGAAVLIFFALCWVCDVRRWQRWAAVFRPAGCNTLLTYLLPDIWDFALGAAGV